ncbi:MAG: metallophosphoesterase [Faecalibacterium sp.]
MHFSISIILGIILALAALVAIAIVCIAGLSQVLSVAQALTGLDLGAARTEKVLVMNDIHYISPKLTDGGAYFTNMVTNSDGKTMLVMEALATAFIDQVLAEAPTTLIIAGDITFNGAKQSHLDFAEHLTRLTDAGISVYTLPGNHDLNCGYAACFAGDGYTRVESVSNEEFREIYAPFGYAGESLMAADEHSLSYMARLSEDKALLMIDCNHDISGILSDETIAFAEAQLIAAQQAGMQVIAVSHQSLMDHNSMLSFGYTMLHAEELLALYEKYNVICNLSGHVHMQHIANSEGGFADIATSALSVYPNQYGVLHWSNDNVSYETAAVELPLWNESSEAIATGYETFAAYSEAFFQSDHSGQFTEALCADFTTAEIAAMTDWASETNLYYFAGRRDLITPDEDTLTALTESGVFFGSYLATIFEDELVDDTKWSSEIPETDSTQS